MKTPKATKLKSGNWRVQIQIDGQRYSRTGKTKKEAQDKIRQLFAGAEMEKRIPLTVGKAIDNYISEKKGTLSPSTIKGYQAIRKNYLQSLMNINISDLTQTDIQIAIGNDAIDGKSPKTIRNAHGLLAAVLDQYRPNFHLNTRLPQKQKYEARIFTEDEPIKITLLKDRWMMYGFGVSDDEIQQLVDEYFNYVEEITGMVSKPA